ncbi:hypothetical protein CR513_14887, partial [Mucuna pruriens]
MYISGGNDLFSSKLFQSTLRGVTMHRLATLPSCSIRSFNNLAALFVADLFDIKQTKGESLKSYLTQFNNATVRVNDPNEKLFVKSFQKGLRVGQLNDSLALRRP